MKILLVLFLLCGHLQPMRCAPAPFTDENLAEHNHTHVRDQRLFSSNTFDSGDIAVSGHVHGHDVSIGSSVDIKVGQSGSKSPPPAPKDVEPKKMPTPVFTDVPGYKQCLGKENMGSYTRWCFPTHKPEACKHESWAMLSHHKKGLDPCSKKELSGLLPPAYTEVPGYKLCLGKENVDSYGPELMDSILYGSYDPELMDSYVSWCFPAHKPEACKHESWLKLSHHRGELHPCTGNEPSDLFPVEHTVASTTPTLTLEQCLDMCQANSCQNDRDVRGGCSQMYSCAHGCKLRHLGLEQNVCSAHCDRNGQSGCFPEVYGWKFELCKKCNRGGCQKWPQVGECEQGCQFYTLHTEFGDLHLSTISGRVAHCQINLVHFKTLG